ncbi:MAG: tetratricopeptide repeat protein [Candidatus Hydrogenedentes bacterium]|nr:tetratricopeptide repeat protein [Candidatus Hydrogenedentota bacterium]
MGKFAYKAIDQSGKETFGVLEAETEADAINEVGRKGLYLTEVRPASMSDEWWVRRQEHRKELEAREAKRTDQARKRQTRQRLVVRYKDGRTARGMCFALNPKEASFHLDVTDENGLSSGTTTQIRYSDLKAVYYVKSFDGKFDKNVRYREWTPEGNELIVEFVDGEVLRGYTLHPYTGHEARFFLIPKDSSTNNISILVEATAVAQAFTPEEFEEKRKQDKEIKKSQEVAADLSQEETMGDFYFETRNYGGALEQYGLAAKKYPQSIRLRRKMLAAQFNIGVQHIKRREYPEALACMKKVLQVDPNNSHAQKKLLQLRKIIERSEHSSGSKAHHHHQES